ncbi:MAG: phosphotransferase [Bacteroides sp.]|nr:phosphotransferase [Bacteroides sp.]
MLPPQIDALISNGLRLLRAEPITGSGSNRQYWRLIFDQAPELIATLGTNLRENEAFIYLAELFAAKGINVPRIVAVSPDSMAYLQTSVGRSSLFDDLSRKDLIAKSMELLARVHSVSGIDYSRCYPVAEMDRRSIFWDLNYFKYCFLKTSPGVNIDESALEDDFELLAADLLRAEPKAFMVRDFQSRNVMISPSGEPYLIDFQGGRLGPVYYDVASFLWQARAGFSPELRSEMISVYCQAARMDEAKFRLTLPTFVIFRLLQVLGAYGFRGRFERKEHFLASIPPAIASLKAEITPRYSYLYDLVKIL